MRLASCFGSLPVAWPEARIVPYVSGLAIATGTKLQGKAGRESG